MAAQILQEDGDVSVCAILEHCRTKNCAVSNVREAATLLRIKYICNQASILKISRLAEKAP